MFRLRSPWLVGLILAAAAALSGCGGGAAPASPTKADGGQTAAHAPVTAGQSAFSLRVANGQEVKYHTTVSSTFHTAAPGDNPVPGMMNNSMTMEDDMTMHFDSVSQSEATVTYSTSGTQVKSDFSVPGSQSPQGMDGVKYTLKINPTTGEVLDVILPSGGGTDKLIITRDQLKKLMGRNFVQVPVGVNAKVGASWTGKVPLPLTLPGGTFDSELTFTTKYEANETRNGTEVAKLTLSGTGPISATIMGDMMVLKGTYETTGTRYVDLKTGLTQEMTSHAVEKYTQSMKGTPAGAEEEVVIDTTMVRQ